MSKNSDKCEGDILGSSMKSVTKVGTTFGLLIYSLTEVDFPLQWRHNERDGVSNHRRFDCLLIRLFKRRSKKTWSKLRVTGICEGNSPHKGPVTGKMFPFDDAIMQENQEEVDQSAACWCFCIP